MTALIMDFRRADQSNFLVEQNTFFICLQKNYYFAAN